MARDLKKLGYHKPEAEISMWQRQQESGIAPAYDNYTLLSTVANTTAYSMADLGDTKRG